MVTMSPERQAIMKAIIDGHCSPKAIGQAIGKSHKTVSKLLYVMTQSGLIQKVGFGQYALTNDSPVSLDKVDNGDIKSRLSSIEKRLHSLESWKTGRDNDIESAIDNQASLQEENAINEAVVTAAELKIKTIKAEAQETIDGLTHKLSDALKEINRLAHDYNALHEKMAAMKQDKPAPKSTKREPLTVNSEAQRVNPDNLIIDSTKAKARVAELARKELNEVDIAQRILDEGYRMKGRDGKIKHYTPIDIKKWLGRLKRN